MTVQQASLENTFQEMGYSSMADYAIQKVREELLRDLKISSDRVTLFETK